MKAVEKLLASRRARSIIFLLFLIPGVPKDILCYVSSASCPVLPWSRSRPGSCCGRRSRRGWKNELRALDRRREALAELFPLFQQLGRGASAEFQRVRDVPFQGLDELVKGGHAAFAPAVAAENSRPLVYHALQSRHLQCLGHGRKEGALVGRGPHHDASIGPQGGENVTRMGARRVEDLNRNACPGDP